MNKETLEAFKNIKAKLEKYEPKDALNLIDFILLEHALTPTNLGDMEEDLRLIMAEDLKHDNPRVISNYKKRFEALTRIKLALSNRVITADEIVKELNDSQRTKEWFYNKKTKTFCKRNTDVVRLNGELYRIIIQGNSQRLFIKSNGISFACAMETFNKITTFFTQQKDKLKESN